MGPISTGHLGHSHTVPPTHNAASSHLTPEEKGGKEEWEIKIPNLFRFYPKGTKKNLVVTECKQVVGNQVKLDNRKILHESAKYIPFSPPGVILALYVVGFGRGWRARIENHPSSNSALSFS